MLKRNKRFIHSCQFASDSHLSILLALFFDVKLYERENRDTVRNTQMLVEINNVCGWVGLTRIVCNARRSCKKWSNLLELYCITEKSCVLLKWSNLLELYCMTEKSCEGLHRPVVAVGSRFLKFKQQKC